MLQRVELWQAGRLGLLERQLELLSLPGQGLGPAPEPWPRGAAAAGPSSSATRSLQAPAGSGRPQGYASIEAAHRLLSATIHTPQYGDMYAHAPERLDMYAHAPALRPQGPYTPPAPAAEPAPPAPAAPAAAAPGPATAAVATACPGAGPAVIPPPDADAAKLLARLASLMNQPAVSLSVGELLVFLVVLVLAVAFNGVISTV